MPDPESESGKHECDNKDKRFLRKITYKIAILEILEQKNEYCKRKPIYEDGLFHELRIVNEDLKVKKPEFLEFMTTVIKTYVQFLKPYFYRMKLYKGTHE